MAEVGRPPKWTEPSELKRLGEEYFDTFKEGGENHGKPITITGLAYHLETTRQVLCDYQEKDEFTDTIKRLKLRVERYAEERLFEGAATGPIFALKNFGWRDTQDITNTHSFTLMPAIKIDGVEKRYNIGDKKDGK